MTSAYRCLEGKSLLCGPARAVQGRAGVGTRASGNLLARIRYTQVGLVLRTPLIQPKHASLIKIKVQQHSLTVKSNRNRGAFQLPSASGHTRHHHPAYRPPPWLSHLYTLAPCGLPDDFSSFLQPCAATSGPQHPHLHPPQQSKESQTSTMSSVSVEAQQASLSSQLSAQIL